MKKQAPYPIKAAQQARKLDRKQATESAEATLTHGIIHQANINTAEHHARQNAARATTGTACTSSRHITQPSTEPPHSHAQNSSTDTPAPHQSGLIHRSKGITNRYPLTRGRTSPNLSPEPLSAPEPPLSPSTRPESSARQA